VGFSLCRNVLAGQALRLPFGWAGAPVYRNSV